MSADLAMRLRTKAKHQRMRDPQIARLLKEAADWVDAVHDPVVDSSNLEEGAMDVGLVAYLADKGVKLLPWQKDRLGIDDD